MLACIIYCHFIKLFSSLTILPSNLYTTESPYELVTMPTTLLRWNSWSYQNHQGGCTWGCVILQIDPSARSCCSWRCCQITRMAVTLTSAGSRFDPLTSHPMLEQEDFPCSPAKNFSSKLSSDNKMFLFTFALFICWCFCGLWESVCCWCSHMCTCTHHTPTCTHTHIMARQTSSFFMFFDNEWQQTLHFFNTGCNTKAEENKVLHVQSFHVLGSHHGQFWGVGKNLQIIASA